jgi:hypothetical protein
MIVPGFSSEIVVGDGRRKQNWLTGKKGEADKF